MNLLLPLGLLGLLAIPLILLIHIIKPKYHERTISSTYIWFLARKYRKRKIPFEKLTQFFLIALQFLIVGAIAFLLAKPLITTPNKIVNDQIILVDCSASMNTVNKEGKTRYSKAVEMIVNSFEKFSENNKFSLIFVDDNPNDGNIINSSNRTELESALREEGRCSLIEVADSEYNTAIEQVKLVLQQNKNADVTIYTDHNMRISGDIKVVNVADSEWNVALLSPVIELNRESGYFEFKTSVCSYNKDADVVLELKIVNPYNNANLVTDARRYYENKILHLKKNVETEISFEGLDVYQFDEASFSLRPNEFSTNLIQDNFVEDNEFYAFNGRDEKFRVEIISESKQFFSAAINILGTCEDIYVAKPGSAKASGYDLYIYDGGKPTTLPTDGAVWIVNPTERSSYLQGAIKFSDPVSQKTYAHVNQNITKPNVSTIVKDITVENPFYVTQYMGIEDYDHEIFDACIVTNEEDPKPLILAGKQGQTFLSIFAFDLHKSSLPVKMFMPILVKNLMEYSVKRVVEKHFYNVGDIVELNGNSSIEKINLVHNGETIVYTKEALQAGASYPIKTSGVYTVIINPDDPATTKNYSFFAGVASSESKANIVHSLALGDRVGNEGTTQEVKSDSKDISMYFAIALLVLLVIEWGVQYREQY